METEIQRIPSGLWDSLQTVCYKHDLKFLQDVSRIIGVSAGDLKRRVLGTRGAPTPIAVITERAGPWWEAQQCPLMVLMGGIWRRCGGHCEAHGACWDHRKYTRPTEDLCHRDILDATVLETRWPMLLESELVWVADDGRVYNDCGELKKGIHISRISRIASYNASEKA